MSSHLSVRVREIGLALAILTGGAAVAEPPAETPPIRAQIEQLQAQLAEMRKEMDALQAALRESEAKGKCELDDAHDASAHARHAESLADDA